MTVTTFRNIAIGAAVSVGLIMLTPVAAQAEGPGANGSVGQAQGLVDGQPIEIQPLAVCAVGGVPAGNTTGAVESGFVRFGAGSSTCSTEAGAAKVEVSGSGFRFDGLRRFGGPTIKITSFGAGCRATGAGSESTVRITGLSGFSVPNPIPVNHTVTIPSTEQDAPPLARVILNEVIQPDPPDGSMTVNLMRITLFPEGVSIHSGEIVVGTVSCSPDPDFAA